MDVAELKKELKEMRGILAELNCLPTVLLLLPSAVIGKHNLEETLSLDGFDTKTIRDRCHEWKQQYIV